MLCCGLSCQMDLRNLKASDKKIDCFVFFSIVFPFLEWLANWSHDLLKEKKPTPEMVCLKINRQKYVSYYFIK